MCAQSASPGPGPLSVCRGQESRPTEVPGPIDPSSLSASRRVPLNTFLEPNRESIIFSIYIKLTSSPTSRWDLHSGLNKAEKIIFLNSQKIETVSALSARTWEPRASAGEQSVCFGLLASRPREGIARGPGAGRAAVSQRVLPRVLPLSLPPLRPGWDNQRDARPRLGGARPCAQFPTPPPRCRPGDGPPDPT